MQTYYKAGSNFDTRFLTYPIHLSIEFYYYYNWIFLRISGSNDKIKFLYRLCDINKDESRRKFINMQCMWKAKDHRQTAQ